MKFILNFYILIFILSCTKDENPQQIQTQGYNMLLIGNSFQTLCRSPQHSRH